MAAPTLTAPLVAPSERPSEEPGTTPWWAWRTIGGSFSSRANSIGFFRWLMAFSVIFSHAGPVAGFYGQKDLGTTISHEQSLGGVAVAGFFFFSGFLITRSRKNTSMVRYFWRRCLRIMPAFWCALLLTGFVLAPVAWHREQGSMAGFWNPPVDSPLSYIWSNMFLVLHQRNIAGMGTSIPYAKLGSYDWNGSAWTLSYEFKAYIMLGLLGLVGWTVNRYLSSAVALVIIVLNGLLWTGHITPWTWHFPGAGFFHDPFNLMLLAPYAAGMLVAIWGAKIPLHGALAAGGIGLALFTYAHGGWNTWGQYGFLYFIMWGAISWTRLQNWERFGDFSYGVYIFAWPLMTFACFYGLQQHVLLYFIVIVLSVHVVAFASWHLIEKPAMSLKDWSPTAVVRARSRKPGRVLAAATSVRAAGEPQ